MSARREVLVSAFELLRVAEGNPMAVVTTDGEELTLRLPSPDEAVEMVRKARANLGITDPIPLAEEIMIREKLAQVLDFSRLGV